MRVLITRPAEDAAASAAALRARGHAAVSAPLLAVEPEPDPTIKLAGAQGFIVTGPEAARMLAAAVGVRTFPVFADSAGTASALKRLGFSNVHAASGDMADLARLIDRTVKPATGALIHACSTTAPVNLSAMLGNMGFAVRPWPLYTLKRADVLPEALRAALADGAVDAAVFFAADEARAFVQLLQKAEMDGAAAKLPVIAATPIVAAPLRALKFASITVPEAADEDSVIAALDRPLVDKVAEEQKEIARQAAERRAAEDAARAEAERREQERKAAQDAARAKAAAEKAEQERSARENAEAERLAREQAAKEKAERDEAERRRLAAERAEKDRQKQDQKERERREKEKRDAEKREQDRLRAEQKEKERLEKEKRAAAKAEQDRVEKEKRAQERAEQERLKQEQRERERLARETAEAERREKERLVREQRETERAERERAERAQEERARQERERYEAEQAARAKAEREALLREREARERADAERRAKEMADDERARREAAERERAARAEAERLREEQQRLDRERKEQERVEKERLQREQDERDRIAREKAEAERREQEARAREEREAAERKRAEAERLDRERRALEKEEQDRLKRERDEQEREAREAAARRRAEEERMAQERRAAEKAEQERLKREQKEREQAEKAQREAERRAQDAAARAARAEEKRAAAERKRLAREEAEKEKAARRQAEKDQAAAARAEKERLKAEAAANVPPRQPLMERFFNWRRARQAERAQPLEDAVLENEPPATADTTKPETSDTLPPSVAAPEPAPVLDRPEPPETPAAPQWEEKPVQPLPESETHKMPDDMRTGAPVEETPRPRTGGRAARLQAEDAADQRRFRADRVEPSGPETVTEDPVAAPAPEKQGGGFGRVLGFVIVLAILVGAVVTTRDWWVPRVMQTMQSPAPAVTAPAPAAPSPDLTALANRVAALESRPAPAPGVTAETLTTLRQDLDTRIAALEGRPAGGGDSTEAVASLGGSISEQARQLVALTARVATLESAVGNIARLEDMNRRLETLEGRSADAASVLALGDRVNTLEAGARRAVTEQTAAVALAMAVGNLREAVAAGRPFALELETVKAMAAKGGAPAVDDGGFAAFAAQGIAPTADLRLRFDTAAPAVMRASAMPDVNASWLRRTFDRLLAVVSIRRVDGLPDGDAPSAVLARAEAHLKAGNLAGAADEMALLTGAAAEAAKPWLDEARARVAAEKAIAESSAQAIAVLAREPAAHAPEGN